MLILLQSESCLFAACEWRLVWSSLVCCRFNLSVYLPVQAPPCMLLNTPSPSSLQQTDLRLKRHEKSCSCNIYNTYHIVLYMKWRWAEGGETIGQECLKVINLLLKNPYILTNLSSKMLPLRWNRRKRPGLDCRCDFILWSRRRRGPKEGGIFMEGVSLLMYHHGDGNTCRLQNSDRRSLKALW